MASPPARQTSIEADGQALSVYRLEDAGDREAPRGAPLTWLTVYALPHGTELSAVLGCVVASADRDVLCVSRFSIATATRPKLGHTVGMSQDVVWPDLPEGQRAAFDAVLKSWCALSEPRLVRISSPLGRGKTYVMQEFYEHLVRHHQPAGGFYGTNLSPEGADQEPWRRARKSVAASVADWKVEPDWAWLSVRAISPFKSDLLGDLRELVSQILTRAATGELESNKVAQLKDTLPDKFTGITGRAVGDLIVDSVPFGGVAKASIRAIVESYSVIKNRGGMLREFAEFLESDTTYEYIALMSLLGQLRNADSSPAILPGILVIENAEQLESTALRSLHKLLVANPDALLSQKNMLSQALYKRMKRHGVPLRLPLQVVLLETTDSGDETIIGPDRERSKRTKATSSPLDQWVEICANDGVSTMEIDSSTLRPVTEGEATQIALKRLPSGLAEHKISTVVLHAKDPFIGGVNPALLASHCEKISMLSCPEEALTPEWADQHLPSFLSVETEQRVESLSIEDRRVLSAAALAGLGFGKSTVEALLPGLDIQPALTRMEEAGYLHKWGGDDLYCFDDNMLYGYGERLAFSDASLCRKALDLTEAPKIHSLASYCVAGITSSHAWVYDWLRGALWRYREIAENAKLDRQWDVHRDIWLAALTLTADRDLIFANLEGYPLETQRINLLSEFREAVPEENENELLWMMLVRWHVHRLTPGPLSLNTLLSSVDTGQDLSNVTRTLPASHKIAARIAGRILCSAIDKRGEIGEVGIRLATRLGPYASLLKKNERVKIGQALLRSGVFSATAAHLCAYEYSSVLDAKERDALAEQLTWWTSVPESTVKLRSLLALSRIGESTSPEMLLPQLEELIVQGAKDDLFQNFDNSGGGFLYGDDPLVYPWQGTRVLLCQEVLRLGAAQATSESPARELIRQVLQEEIESHPSAIGLLMEYYSGELSREVVEELSQLKTRWKKTGLVGHSEQGGLVVLKGAERVPHAVRRPSKKRKKKKRKR